jgi:hypothetical protein
MCSCEAAAVGGEGCSLGVEWAGVRRGPTPLDLSRPSQTNSVDGLAFLATTVLVSSLLVGFSAHLFILPCPLLAPADSSRGDRAPAPADDDRRLTRFAPLAAGMLLLARHHLGALAHLGQHLLGWQCSFSILGFWSARASSGHLLRRRSQLFSLAAAPRTAGANCLDDGLVFGGRGLREEKGNKKSATTKTLPLSLVLRAATAALYCPPSARLFAASSPAAPPSAGTLWPRC